MNPSQSLCNRADRSDKKGFTDYLRNRFEERNQQAKVGFNTPSLISIGFVWDQTSHLASMADIIIGSLNYVVNHPERDKAGKAIIKKLKPMIWGKRSLTGIKKVRGRGLVFRPDRADIWKKSYRDAYDETLSRIISWANNPD